MRPGSIALGVAAAAVAVGGIYLYLSLQSGPAEPTPEQALAAAQAAHGRAAGRPAGDDRDQARPALPPRRGPQATLDRGAADRVGVPAPQADYRKGGSPIALPELPDKYRADVVDEARAPDLATADQSDHLLEANKLYDKGDFDGARQLAQKLLGEMPGNVRMLRVVISSSCIMGDADIARKYATELPPADLEAMVARCSKFEIALK